MKKYYLVKLGNNERFVEKIKYFKIPFTNYYLTKSYPVIYAEDAGRHFEAYDIKTGLFFNTVENWW